MQNCCRFYVVAVGKCDCDRDFSFVFLEQNETLFKYFHFISIMFFWASQFRSCAYVLTFSVSETR